MRKVGLIRGRSPISAPVAGRIGLCQVIDISPHGKYYTEREGRAAREEFERQWARMSVNDKSELMEIIGSGGGTVGLRKACKHALESKATSWRVREVLPCYAMETRGDRSIEHDREVAEKLRQGIAIEDAGLGETI